MKIRIHNNTIRLRLSMSEVEQLSEKNEIKEELKFPSPYPSFIYNLKASAKEKFLSLTFEQGEISISLPLSEVKDWANTEQIGIAKTQSLEDGINLQLLVEKDFQCLHKRPGENETDNFPNPQA
ncbi:MAG: hypothetical protein GYB55_04840 [Cytophagales bacterium]|uniref:DUF7009 family protein n=1 Tax=Cyclobacterium marinum TaxID=104 RepID=UPI0011EDD391|nr:hypothetical protein [Cyclobacterium marinum]MBI0399630.1 hypothetical protein [Cyclobacterium marinum]MBR9774353.1 hypothetical protein [Cytophagales bacterium]|tara:strand:+ start:36857 stop:37228 length:372 start_codon:yes stop_codon:yes gene_type:complete